MRAERRNRVVEAGLRECVRVLTCVQTGGVAGAGGREAEHASEERREHDQDAERHDQRGAAVGLEQPEDARPACVHGVHGTGPLRMEGSESASVGRHRPRWPIPARPLRAPPWDTGLTPPPTPTPMPLPPPQSRRRWQEHTTHRRSGHCRCSATTSPIGQGIRWTAQPPPVEPAWRRSQPGTPLVDTRLGAAPAASGLPTWLRGVDPLARSARARWAKVQSSRLGRAAAAPRSPPNMGWFVLPGRAVPQPPGPGLRRGEALTVGFARAARSDDPSRARWRQ